MARRALELVPPDSLKAGYLLDILGLAQALEDRNYEGARDSYIRSIEIARREGDKVLEVRTLRDLASLYYYQEQWAEALDACLPTIEMAQSIGEIDTLVLARNVCANCLTLLGQGEQAQFQATDCRSFQNVEVASTDSY